MVDKESINKKTRERLKIWRANNPEKVRNKNYQDRYGISLDEYKVMLKKQKERCFLCNTHNDDSKLFVDHCHTTKKVRKLLCQHCNSGLGYFKDNKKILKKAINYLIKY